MPFLTNTPTSVNIHKELASWWLRYIQMGVNFYLYKHLWKEKSHRSSGQKPLRREQHILKNMLIDVITSTIFAYVLHDLQCD